MEFASSDRKFSIRSFFKNLFNYKLNIFIITSLLTITFFLYKALCIILIKKTSMVEDIISALAPTGDELLSQFDFIEKVKILTQLLLTHYKSFMSQYTAVIITLSTIIMLPLLAIQAFVPMFISNTTRNKPLFYGSFNDFLNIYSFSLFSLSFVLFIFLSMPSYVLIGTSTIVLIILIPYLSNVSFILYEEQLPYAQAIYKSFYLMQNFYWYYCSKTIILIVLSFFITKSVTHILPSFLIFNIEFSLAAIFVDSLNLIIGTFYTYAWYKYLLAQK